MRRWRTSKNKGLPTAPMPARTEAPIRPCFSGATRLSCGPFCPQIHFKIIFVKYLYDGADLAGFEAECRDCLQERDGVQWLNFVFHGKRLWKCPIQVFLKINFKFTCMSFFMIPSNHLLEQDTHSASTPYPPSACRVAASTIFNCPYEYFSPKNARASECRAFGFSLKYSNMAFTSSTSMNSRISSSPVPM